VRYRVPLEPLLLVVVAALVARWINRRAESEAGPTSWPVDPPAPADDEDDLEVLEPVT
jgi:hypothetical protein